MVRRLVQHQQVGLLHQQACEMRPHHPAAAQLFRGPVEVLHPEGQPREDRFGPRFEFKAVQLGVACVRIEVLVRMLLEELLRILDPFAGLAHFRRHGQREVQHRLVADRRAFLRQEAQGGVAFAHDLTGVRLFLAEDHAKQRGFARAVGAHEPDAVTAIDLRGDIREQRAATIGLGNARQSKHGRG